MRTVIASFLAASLAASPLSAQLRDAQARADKIFESIDKDAPGCAAGAMLGGKLPPPTAQELAALAGRYASAEQGVEVVIAAQDGRLVLKGQPMLRMTADSFSADHPFGAVRFTREGGRVTGFTINGAIQNLRFDKVN